MPNRGQAGSDTDGRSVTKRLSPRHPISYGEHRMFTILIALTLAGCGPKEAPPVAAAAPAVEAPPPAPVVVEPPPPPPEVKNADFNVTITAADGSKTEGHVKRIERGEDTYGESWTTADKAMAFYVEGNGEYKKIKWSDVKRVSISIPNAKDFDCLYSSDYSPWMYECSLRLKSTITTKDGKSYKADSGHKWMFVTDDDSEHTFWLTKHYARQQDEKVVDLEVTNPENYTLYGELQARLRNEIKADLVKSIVIQ